MEKTNELGWDIYIRMELLVPFNTYISDKKLTEKEVIKLGCDICTALEICAKRNIIHRDIKLENIFVSGFGDFKLGDFGVARMLENTTGGLSQKGAPNYMAPEVALGEKYDFRVDIYSLGIVLYRLLNANRLPFLDTERQLLNYAERKNAIERRLRGEAFNAPRDASLEMSDVILRACAYDPNKRFSSATEMKHALMSVANGTYQVGGASDPDGTISVHRIPAVSDKQADEPISPEIVASELNSTISVHRISAAPDQQVDEPASSVLDTSEPDGTISVRRVLDTSDPGAEYKVDTFGSASNDDENKRKKLKKIIVIASSAGAACLALVLTLILLSKVMNTPQLSTAESDVSSVSEESVTSVSSNAVSSSPSMAVSASSSSATSSSSKSSSSSSSTTSSSSEFSSSSTTTTSSTSKFSSSSPKQPEVPTEPAETTVTILGKKYDVSTTTVIQVDEITDEQLKAIIPEIKKLKNLNEFYMTAHEISDITPISNLTNLTKLYLVGTQATDLAPITNLKKLTYLDLRFNQISDLTPITNLTHLTYLDLGGNPISDIKPLSELSNLKKLLLWDNPLSDITPLANLINLKELTLDENQISDITPLANLTNLTLLWIRDNQINDITPLAKLTNLTSLELSDNLISNITPLTNLTNLTSMSLNGNPISENDIASLRASIPNCDILFF